MGRATARTTGPRRTTGTQPQENRARSAGRVLLQRVRDVRTGVGDAGMATAEYAIATLAAVGFAGVLIVVLKGNEVKSLLSGIVRQALGS